MNAEQHADTVRLVAESYCSRATGQWPCGDCLRTVRAVLWHAEKVGVLAKFGGPEHAHDGCGNTCQAKIIQRLVSDHIDGSEGAANE